MQRSANTRAACIIRPGGRSANANVTAPLHDRDMAVTAYGQVVLAHCGRDWRRRQARRLQGAGLEVRGSESVAPLTFCRPGRSHREWQGHGERGGTRAGAGHGGESTTPYTGRVIVQQED